MAAQHAAKGGSFANSSQKLVAGEGASCNLHPASLFV